MLLPVGDISQNSLLSAIRHQSARQNSYNNEILYIAISPPGVKFKSFTCLLPNNSFVNMKTMATPPMLKPCISTFCLCYHLNSSPLAADKEAHLCLSQADEVLNNIQHHLHMMPSVIGFGHGQHTASQQLTQKTQALMDIGQVPCKDPSLWCPIHSHL